VHRQLEKKSAILNALLIAIINIILCLQNFVNYYGYWHSKANIKEFQATADKFIYFRTFKDKLKISGKVADLHSDVN